MKRLPVVDADRPRVWSDCEEGGKNAARPCPWVSCRHHLLLDVSRHGGGRRSVSKSRDFDESDADSVAFVLLAMPHTCSLDVAEDGEHTLEAVGEFMNVTRQRVEAIEHVAQRRAQHIRRAGEARAEWRALLTRD